MTDSYELLKNMTSLDEAVSAEASETNDAPVTNALYQEVVDAEIAKRILGSRYIDKPDITWQLVTTQEETVLVAYRTGEEPVHFVLNSDDEVQTYDEMRNTVNNFIPASTEVVESIRGKDSPWLTLVIIFMIAVPLLSIFLTWFVLTN